MNRRPSGRPSLRAHRRRGERGFALLEILVAFAVLAIGVGTISVGIAVAMRSDSRTQTGLATMLLAQSRLEAAGIAEPLVPGKREGRVGRKYRWLQTIDEIRSRSAPKDGQGHSQAQQPASAVRSFWVTVSIEAADGTTMKVSALKLAPGSGP